MKSNATFQISDLDGEVGIVDLEDLEVVEADVDVEGADAAGQLVHVHRRDVPAHGRGHNYLVINY